MGVICLCELPITLSARDTYHSEWACVVLSCNTSSISSVLCYVCSSWLPLCFSTNKSPSFSILYLPFFSPDVHPYRLNMPLLVCPSFSNLIPSVILQAVFIISVLIIHPVIFSASCFFSVYSNKVPANTSGPPLFISLMYPTEKLHPWLGPNL